MIFALAALHPRNLQFVALSSRSCPRFSTDSPLTFRQHNPCNGWNLMGMGLVRTEDLGETFSTISRPFQECSPQPISTDQSVASLATRIFRPPCYSCGGPIGVDTRRAFDTLMTPEPCGRSDATRARSLLPTR